MNIRKEKGMTQQQLAEKLYITDKAVSKWERGLSFPDITILKSLAEILELDVSELLNCKKGKKEDIDIQKIVDEKIQEIEKLRKEKLKKEILKISILVIIVLLLCCFSIKYYKKYHPKNIKDGENTYSLGSYNLTKKGLDKMMDIIQKSDEMTNKYTVAYFEARVNSRGNIKSFTLSLNAFDENEQYVGRVGYTYKKNKLTYNLPVNDNLPIVIEYDKNSDIEYISNCMKKIPLKEQIKKSNLTSYVVRYMPNTIIESGKPIFDMRTGEKAVLNKEDYDAGKGGISDGNTNVVIRLYDGVSMISEEQYLYVFSATHTSLSGNPNYMMEADYYIDNKGKLKFTRDYGRTWINADISKEELDDTLEFYNSLSLTPNSWFMSKNESLPIAYFYGRSPILKISLDNGTTWKQANIDTNGKFVNYITKRVIGFTSKNFGYVALGTDYSKYYGESKKMYLTYDSGKTWEERELPLNNSANTLVDLCMYDENTGVLILDNTSDVNFPIIYATKDGGKNWQEVKFSYFNFPDEIQYIVDIDSITKENEDYILTLGQGEKGTLKAVFSTRDLFSPWLFNKTLKKNIHTVG